MIASHVSTDFAAFQCVAFGRDFTTSIEVKDPDAADRNEAWFMAGGTKTVVKFSGDFTPLMVSKPSRCVLRLCPSAERRPVTGPVSLLRMH